MTRFSHADFLDVQAATDRRIRIAAENIADGRGGSHGRPSTSNVSSVPHSVSPPSTSSTRSSVATCGEATMTCPPEHKHGATVTCYQVHRCRCDACRAANTEAARRLRSGQGRVRVPGRVVAKGDCPRCGVPGGERRHALCRDCRDVLNKEEREVWAA